MSYSESYDDPSMEKCQWCFRQTTHVQKGENCRHTICNKCIINDKSCKSDCPLCWNINITEYIRVNRICSVCCSGLQPGDRTFQCDYKHPHCPRCTPDGCKICQFRELKAGNDKNYRSLSPGCQSVLSTCHIWQQKFEASQPDKENPSSMEYDNHSQSIAGLKSSESKNNKSTNNVESGDCMVCLERLGSTYKTLDKCGHSFHPICIDTWFQSSGKQSCPSCGYVYGISKGPQPSNGRMTLKYLPTPLAGFEKAEYGYKEHPTIEITYSFPSGIQGPLNPCPNKPFSGTTRKAYLPNNKEGKEILKLLQRAFEDQHIFTIGRSTTTGQDNVVTWNDIHHKTSPYGGPEGFGYPDPTYLYRVRQELADKGYK